MTIRGQDTRTSTRNYFVDEAGDANLFDRKGRVIVGRPGCSRFFTLGMLDLPDPPTLDRDLCELRMQLLHDPYFQGVPSMRPDQGKTAYAFHAKDDLPEVRREVFRLLQRHEMRFYAVVRDKISVLRSVQERSGSPRRYHPNELYDQLVRRLFRDRLHKDDAYNIHFARRGKADRTQALAEALSTARRRFAEKWSIKSEAPIRIFPGTPMKVPGLQATDYFLWSLQRLWERGDERYLRLLWPAVGLVHDVDDKRLAQYGVYYTQKNPVPPEGPKKMPEI